MNTKQKELLQKTLDRIIDYIENLEDDKGVIKYKTPAELNEKFNLNSKIENDYNAINDDIKNYLTYSVRTGNKQFFNQLYAGFNFPAFLAEIIAVLTNTSMYTYEVAPVATLMELELIEKMCSFTGFLNGEGTFVTGGSNSNYMAMLCARNKKTENAKMDGLYSCKKLTAFVSEQSHYSFDKAANLIGIGVNNVIKVKSDVQGKIIPEELEKEIKQSIKRNENPFFMAATTGTTLLGAYDPIPEMHEIAKKYNLWLHADGSWGGSVILSKKHKHLLSGLNLADSFAWNPHKLMNIPLIASALLFKEKGTMWKNFSSHNTDYIFHDYDNADFDLGPKSMQCGKRVDSFKLWLSWKFYGNRGYEKRINKLFELADYFEKKVAENPKLELLAPRQSLNVCFRYKPSKSNININSFNLKLRNNVMQEGKSLINYGFLNKNVAIRFVIANPEVNKPDIDILLNNILNEAKKIDI
ncbi:MAG: glutamate decarboxylase [Chlorobi bacterium]|nr:glutamate decarboxylase [Chlorobiota bacterium]